MPDVGLPELLIILAIVLLLFGATRLPKLGRSLGEGISGFRKGLHEGESPDEKGGRDESPAPAPDADSSPHAESPSELDSPPEAESPPELESPRELESPSEVESRKSA
jgi:sec-independent protein translocase protein TatA